MVEYKRIYWEGSIKDGLTTQGMIAGLTEICARHEAIPLDPTIFIRKEGDKIVSVKELYLVQTAAVKIRFNSQLPGRELRTELHYLNGTVPPVVISLRKDFTEYYGFEPNSQLLSSRYFSG